MSKFSQLTTWYAQQMFHRKQGIMIVETVNDQRHTETIQIDITTMSHV